MSPASIPGNVVALDREGHDAAERRRRRITSSKPVVVDAELPLGFELELEQSPQSEGALPLPLALQSTPERPVRWPGDKTTWSFRPTGLPVSIRGAGCSNSYGVIGAPGTGKSHLVRNTLRAIIDYAPDCPEKRFGGLILDPKGAIIDDVLMMLEGHPREKDLIVIDGSDLQAPVNVIHCSLRTRELARTLVLAAQSSGVTAKEPYWFLAWTNLFAAAMTLLEYRYARELTIGRIVEAVTETGEDGRREIETIAEEMQPNPAAWAAVCAAYGPGRSAGAIEGEIRRAVNDIRSFYSAKADHVATVETFIINAFGEFRDDRCRPFSPPARDWTDPGLSGPSFYDSILEEGRIVLVSLPPSEATLAKTLCTVIKCLFQQTVIGRKRRFRDLQLHNWDRVVFLACDEYSEIASEVPGQPVGDGRFFALARENGCMGLLATQSVHVLENSSLRDAWRSIFSNFAAKIFLGVADVETARQATELAGKLDWRMRTPTASYSPDGFGISIQKDLREREEIPTSILTQVLQRGEAVVVGSLDGRAERPRARILEVKP